MSNIFSDLQQVSENQKKLIEGQPTPNKTGESDTQKVTQPSKRLSKPTSRNLLKTVSNPPSTEDVEELAFRLRREAKARINADVPQRWKIKLDDLAHQLQIGKYDLIAYIIAQFLGEIEGEDRP